MTAERKLSIPGGLTDAAFDANALAAGVGRHQIGADGFLPIIGLLVGTPVTAAVRRQAIGEIRPDGLRRRDFRHSYCPNAAAKYKVPFAIVADKDKKLYRKFGLKQMSPLGFLSPGLALKGVAAIAGGHGIGMPQGDVRQLPGVFIINTAGQIVFSHFAGNPADHPDVATLMAAIRKQP